MTDNTPLPAIARVSAFLLLLLTFTPAVSRANKPNLDSIAALKEVVPESVSLDGRVVYVDFWASWCHPCQESLPWVERMYDRYGKKGLQVVGICLDKNHAAALKFIADHNVRFPIVFDSTAIVAKSWGLQTIPTSYLYGRDGRLITRDKGFVVNDTDKLEQTIVRNLNETASK